MAVWMVVRMVEALGNLMAEKMVADWVGLMGWRLVLKLVAL